MDSWGGQRIGVPTLRRLREGRRTPPELPDSRRKLRGDGRPRASWSSRSTVSLSARAPIKGNLHDDAAYSKIDNGRTFNAPSRVTLPVRHAENQLTSIVPNRLFLEFGQFCIDLCLQIAVSEFAVCLRGCFLEGLNIRVTDDFHSFCD